MAAGAVTVYSQADLAMRKGSMNLSTDTFVVCLVGSGYTPAPNTDSTWANVSANEITGTGYTPGGIALTSQSWTTSGGIATFTAAGVSWPTSTLSARYAVIVRRASSSLAGTDLLVGYFDLNSPSGPNVTSTNGTFAITWNASGIFTSSHTP